MHRLRSLKTKELPPLSAGGRPPSDDATVTFLLLELRRANRSLFRLRSVVDAARRGDEEGMKAALARLRPPDFLPHSPASPE